MADSIFNPDKKCLFREDFSSEANTRRLGGVPSNVTYLNGQGTFTSGKIIYSRLGINNSGFSIRIRAKIDWTKIFDYILNNSKNTIRVFTNAGLVSFSGSNYVYIDGGTTPYLSNALTPSAGVVHEFVFVSTASLNTFNNIYLNCTSTGTVASATNIYEIFEIYNYALTANEVKSLYENKRYRVPNIEHGEQLGPELVNQSTFNTLAYWNVKEANWSVVGGVLTSNGSSGELSKNNFWTLGRRYKISVTVTRTGGTFYPLYDGAITWVSITSSNTYTTYYIPLSTTKLTNYSSLFAGTITAMSIKEVLVNSTKTILDVNAFDGVCKNRLSGNPYNEIVTNPTFDDPTKVILGTGWSLVDGKLHGENVTGGSNYAILTVNRAITIDSTYDVRFTISNYISGGVNLNVGTNSAFGVVSGDGTFTKTITTAGTSTVRFYSHTGFIGDIDNVSVKEVIPSVVNTSVSVVKENDRYVPRFNSTTSKISAGSYDTLVGDISVSGWFNAKTLGEGSAGVLISNGQFIVAANTTNKRISVTSNNSTVIYSGNNAIDLNDYVHLGIIRTSTGVVNIYINGVLSGSANQASGTPVAGSDIIIGNNTGQTATWDGLIPQVKIVSGIMTASELMDEYTANKMSYGL